MATTLKTIRKVIATAGTPTQITNAFNVVQRGQIHSPSINTGQVYFGESTLAATLRASLAPGERFDFGQIDLSKLYVDVAVNNEAVEVIFFI